MINNPGIIRNRLKIESAISNDHLTSCFRYKEVQ